ncbi:hypothetical protein [Tenacibaculum sp. SG-28]|uniref:hypothetical protein n=1 Tax=Tenacibaculum sp. SG-28 TaxID=754426 RepID=UPI0011B070A7|nr:hypothetical protein [Tenacibaculum sp. SG-28]
MQNSQSGESISARFTAYNKSIALFGEYPIFGGIQNKLGKNNYGELNSFGQHSQIIDTFALFGFFVGIIQLFIYFKPILNRLIKERIYVNSLSLSMLISFFTISVLNNVTPSIGLAVFFIYPTLIELNKVKNV